MVSVKSLEYFWGFKFNYNLNENDIIKFWKKNIVLI